MDKGFLPNFNILENETEEVAILIIMDKGFLPKKETAKQSYDYCRNPYYNG